MDVLAAAALTSALKYRPGLNDALTIAQTCGSGVRVFRAHPEEGEVPAAVDARDLQVAHDDLTVFIVLPHGLVLLLQVRQRAQLVLRTSAHWGETTGNRKQWR